MPFVRVPASILRVVSPLVRFWWRMRRPTTFGVKVLVTHGPRFLVVRHSYSDPHRWGLPGGGYRPDRETPQEAGAREAAEELGVVIEAADCRVLAQLVTTLEGKRDTLTILTAGVASTRVRLSPELTQARWISDLPELGDAPVSRWLTTVLADMDTEDTSG